MQSRLLKQLDAQLARSRGPVSWACIQAQRALYFARQGERERATELIAKARERFGTRPQAEVTAWVSLAEAVNQFYAKPGPVALDRLKRAELLAGAIQHPVLVPLCAAWLAHLEFNANHMEAMAAQVGKALKTAQPEHHSALARVSLVVADALHHADRFDLAKPWYAKVREHALAEGDDMMLSAMLHNVAAIRANNARLADAFGLAAGEESRRAEFEAESTKNYDELIGTQSLPTLVPLMRAQISAVSGRYEDAIRLFDAALNEPHEDLLERRFASLKADRAWCLYALGRHEEALADLEGAVATEHAEADDLACMHARASAVHRGVSNLEMAKHHEDLANHYLMQHRTNRQTLLEMTLHAIESSFSGKSA